MTPMARPDTPALQAWLDRLRRRPGCLAFALNGTP